jgi:hypothetical protein
MRRSLLSETSALAQTDPRSAETRPHCPPREPPRARSADPNKAPGDSAPLHASGEPIINPVQGEFTGTCLSKLMTLGRGQCNNVCELDVGESVTAPALVFAASAIQGCLNKFVWAA